MIMEKHWVIFDQVDKQYYEGQPKGAADVFIWTDKLTKAYVFEHETSAIITIKEIGFGWLTLIEIYKNKRR